MLHAICASERALRGRKGPRSVNLPPPVWCLSPVPSFDCATSFVKSLDQWHGSRDATHGRPAAFDFGPADERPRPSRGAGGMSSGRDGPRVLSNGSYVQLIGDPSTKEVCAANA